MLTYKFIDIDKILMTRIYLIIKYIIEITCIYNIDTSFTNEV